MDPGSHTKDVSSLIDSYDLFIFDLDGTLYDQHKLRNIIMAALIFRWLTFRIKFSELRIILTFRKLREQNLGYESPEINEEQYHWCAEALNLPVGIVQKVIEHWMLTYPLVHLRKARYPKVKSFFLELKKHHKNIAVFSDFPVDKKLEALRLAADKTFCSTEGQITQLKPSRKGVEQICQSFGCPLSRTVFFGDRQDTDGESARLAGVDFRLIDVREARRGNYYKKLLHDIIA